jgi:hypothetical protein
MLRFTSRPVEPAGTAARWPPLWYHGYWAPLESLIGVGISQLQALAT